MTRITVVIEDHAEGIHLGQQLAGGRVVAAMHGDHSDLLEALVRLKIEVVLSNVDPEYIKSHFRPWLDKAEAAILKAHGN